MTKFKDSKALTFGIEMELQIIQVKGGMLSPAGGELLDSLPAGTRKIFTPEATQSTIEFVSTVHDEPDGMLAEAQEHMGVALECAAERGLRLRGGGNHAMHFWSDRIMSDTTRGGMLEAKYGFLPKRFSTYGLHVHTGMPDAASAIRTGNVLTKLTPMFIALAAGSPFHQGYDTGFCSCRPLESLVYPFSGPMPEFADWDDFERKTAEIYKTGLASSLKDLYWDVRPKPEYGTIEVRSFDMPLQVEKAVALGVFVRRCCALVLQERLQAPEHSLFNLDDCNRFLACRDGMGARLLNPFTGEKISMREWFVGLMAQVRDSGITEAEARHLDWLERSVSGRSDAQWMRDLWEQTVGPDHSDLGAYSEQLASALLAH